MELYNEAQLTRNAGATPKYSQLDIDNTRNHVNPYVYPDVNWQDMIFKDMNMNQRVNVNISGGGSKASYYMSLQANHDTGLLNTKKVYSYNNNINNWGYNFQNNISYKVTPTTKIDLHMNAQIRNMKGPNYSTSELFKKMLYTNPVYFPATFPAQEGEKDIERKVLHFFPADTGKTYWHDGESYWRVMAFIPNAKTYETVNPEYSYYAGVAFGNFQAMLADIPDKLGETIPDFHNMEFRLKQLRDAVAADTAGRVKEVRYFLDEIERRAEEMCKAERLHREGKLPKRVCHCDTKVNNMMFDESGNVLCVIDLDTVMPSFVFSDFGDFLRSGANTGLEDDKDLANVNFNMEIFKAFTKGYLESAKSFLLPVEIENLPYAAALFPYMQCVRFLADYINGDTYYKIQNPEHNLVRTKAQFKLLQSVEEHTPEMQKFIASCI